MCVRREKIRRETEVAVQRRLSLQTTKGSNGAVVGRARSTVKKVEKT